MRYTSAILVVLVALIASFAAAPSAFAGPSQPVFIMSIDGWEGAITASIDPLNLGEDVPFVYPTGAGSLTVAYLTTEDGQKLSVQTFARPYPSGDYQWIGHIEVGAADTRLDQSLHLSIFDNMGLNWMTQIYSCDTRHLVSREFVYPNVESFTQWSTNLTAATSQSGYDFLVAAWDPSPAPVPEPGSLLALATGLTSFAGFALRRRRSVP